MMVPFMAGDWLCMHQLGNQGIVVPNINMNMCKTTISKSDDYNKTSKLWVLTDKKLSCA